MLFDSIKYIIKESYFSFLIFIATLYVVKYYKINDQSERLKKVPTCRFLGTDFSNFSFVNVIAFVIRQMFANPSCMTIAAISARLLKSEASSMFCKCIKSCEHHMCDKTFIDSNAI